MPKVNQPWWDRFFPFLNFPGAMGIVLFTAISFLAGGCGTDITSYPVFLRNFQESVPSGNINPDKGTLLIWFALDSAYLHESQVERYHQYLAGMVDEFKKAYPNVKVNYKFVASDDLLEPYLHDIDHGFGPDLVLTKNLYLGRLMERNALFPIPYNEIALDNFRQDALSQMEYGGKLYAIPVTLGTQTLCYNKKKVKQVPTNLDEIVSLSRQGYSFGITSNFSDTLWGLGAFGGKVFNQEGEVILNQGAWSKWMEFLITIKNEPNVVFIPTSLATNRAFSEGRLAYITCWSLAIPELIASVGLENLGIAPLPGLPGAPSSPALTGFSFVLNPTSNDEQRGLALKAATFFTNTEQQQQWILESRSAIPVNVHVQIPSSLFTIQAQLKKQSLTATSYSMKEIDKIEFMLDIGERFYTSVLSGAITSQAAAQEITEQTNQYFGEQADHESKHQ
ncbi:extracellular solute-binding protein [Synechocystis sp. FACHB-383]|uniref:sugar ABC transporter substrate-binding protein n=1 Tax=Synechocystis sp. FACHB-383 TaxID=2692864 RepID=UPI0016842C03|nr:extracellular solute-binding protein [Synechocystis sp. FACHB-383]MBD2653521.1 extracellular solute-binding protein [Synechocystis sp. FACHB-383]